MKRLFWVAVAVHSCLISPASGQSLAELAKKERERRKKIEGKSTVVTEENLREAAGSTLSTMGEASNTTSSGTGESSLPTETKKDQPEGEEASATARDRLSRLKQSFADRLSQAMSRVRKARNDVATCADRDKRYVVDSMGNVLDMSRERCAAAQKTLSESQDVLKQIQNECLNEARKMNIIPGDARTVCFPRI